MEWMATITGDHVGYPGLRDLRDFSPKKEKNLVEHKFAHLSVSNFHGRNPFSLFIFGNRFLRFIFCHSFQRNST
jgi:hypothetical protein